ncbi:putative enoyl-CoA hydratase/isomerase YngF [Alicyclobacillus acidoterrestris]|uniref:enoyl-CoA hydratase-related protein n=1 Tax=Alicyclobacillus suci TaxID=2816080 RepID=UPI00119107F4|nr:enoyl-CoA hydratase-related protein [Alicyclobacillus suci]GEO25915.1 putative enoyl-CoA hydratase/isomerase YngF [Alicyclobacillus acidoterrestris]
MTDEQVVVKYEEEHIAFVKLNRPHALNALNYESLCVLGELVNEIRVRRDLRAVVFFGEGKAFCAGADLKERRTLSPDQVRRNVLKIRDVFTEIENLPQPTIAVLHGFALGGGFELSLACDLRYAAKHTQFGLIETSLAIIPGAGGTQRLTRLVGPMWAKKLIFTAERIQPDFALQLGILTGVEADFEFAKKKAITTAREIAENGPIAVRQAKFAINQGQNVDLSTGLEIESQAYELLIPTKDRLEALDAFAERRKPVFLGE